MEEKLIQIWNYLDGELSIEEQKEFEQKLQDSSDLKLLFGQQKDIHQSLKKAILHKPSPTFSDDLMYKVSMLQSSQPATSFNGIKYVLLAFGAIIAFSSLFLLSPEMNQSPYAFLNLEKYMSKYSFSLPQGMTLKLTPYYFVFAALLVLVWFDNLFSHLLLIKSKK